MNPSELTRLEEAEHSSIQAHSGSKYLRVIHSAMLRDCSVLVDVYAVLEAFAVTCPAVQHAVKKLLCAGLRGKNTVAGDLKEARDSISRAIEIQATRESQCPVCNYPEHCCVCGTEKRGA